MKKTLVSMMMAMSMILTMTPMTVKADDVVDTEAELIAAMEAGGEVTLGGDIELYTDIEVDNDLILDLNGHTITLSLLIDDDNWRWGSITIGLINPCDVIIKDSVGDGSIEDDGSDYGAVWFYQGTCTIESGSVCDMGTCGGELNLNGGSIEYAFVDILNGSTVVNKSTEAVVEKWDIFGGTFDFDPTEYLYTGFKAEDNGDGTYTVGYEPVETTGETFTVYFNNYVVSEEYDMDEYYFSPDEENMSVSVDNINVNILRVMGNDEDVVSIPMTRLDDNGIYWSAEVDVAYMNALMQFHCEEIRASTFWLKMPDKDGVEYNFVTEWTIYGMDEDINDIKDEIATFDEDTVTANDKAALETILADVEEKLADDKYFSDAQKKALEDLKVQVQAYLDVISGNGQQGNGDSDNGNNNNSNGNNGNSDNGNDNNGNQQGSGSVDGGSVDAGDSVNAVIWIALMFVNIAVFMAVKMSRRTSQE